MRGRGIDTPRLQHPFAFCHFFFFFSSGCRCETKKVLASSGNRTRAARVAGEHSTTEPTMLVYFVAMQQCSSCGRVVKATDSKSVSLWEHRFESYRLRTITFCSKRLDLSEASSSMQIHFPHVSIVGSVVECSPATRAARVRFPDDASFFFSKMFCPPYLNRIDVVKFSNFKVPHDSL